MNFVFLQQWVLWGFGFTTALDLRLTIDVGTHIQSKRIAWVYHIFLKMQAIPITNRICLNPIYFHVQNFTELNMRYANIINSELICQI